jgi:hypothetical protein
MRNYETKVYEYIEKDTGRQVIKAVTTYAGKAVSAYSKCDPKDTFDLKFGTDVALKRLDIKIAQKRANAMKTRAKYCQMNLEFIEQEKRRIERARNNAEIAYFDRKVEIRDLEAEIANMLKDI